MYCALAPSYPRTLALVELAYTFTPRVEICGSDVVLDLAGLTRLFGHPRDIGDELRRMADARALSVGIAIAGTCTAARLFALVGSRQPAVGRGQQAAGKHCLLPTAYRLPSTDVIVIEPGAEAAAMARLPLELLGRIDSRDFVATFRRWGIRTFGQLAALPPDAVAARLGADGVRWDQMTASYAMAENVYAVTQSGPGTLRRLGVDREAFVTGHRLLPATGASAMTLVGSGSVLPGTELRIVDGAGTVCADGAVGEIHLRGACRFQGYLRRPDLSAAAIDAEGWYGTGDLGAMVEGELFVTGRLKDLVIIQGRNFYPGDVELEVGEVPGVAAGRVAAFGVPDERDGTERLVVVAERDADSTEPDAAVALRVRAHVAQMFNCTAGDVRMVPPRWLVKATSGKVARADTRVKYLRDVH